jgi:hypothetical protein
MIAKHVFRWDLDKTYLRTEFDTMRDLLKSAFEKPQDKRAVPGAPAIMRALRVAGGLAHRICIISGSPRQMRRVLEAKLALDGVEWDEFVLKNNLGNMLRGRFRAVREQVGYKLPALLESRVAQGGAAGETLFGDDAESDAVIYSLYADVIAGRVQHAELDRALTAAHVYDDVRAHTHELAERAPHVDVVRRIVIHLDRRSPTARFDRFGPRVVPVYNYFQAALVLYEDGQLAAVDVLRVAREMLASKDYVLASLANSLQDLLGRGRMSREVALRLALECEGVIGEQPDEWRDLPPISEIAAAFAARVRALGGDHGAPARQPERLDYPALVAEHRRRKRD